MARPLRIEFPDALYHVTARGNARADVYLDYGDRSRFLRILGEACERYRWRCHAWCLMTNHYHLVVETAEGNLSRGMRHLNGVYTQSFNRAHGRVGHVFQGRYTAILVERESHLLELCRYVVLNPVRAGLVGDPGRWAWSSYRASAGAAAAPGWLETGWLLASLGRPAARARAAYAAFVAEGIGAPSVWEGLKSQIYLGSDAFAEAMRERVAPGPDRAEIPAAQRERRPPPLAAYAAARADRGEAMARAYLDGGYSQAEIARHFGVHYSTVSRAVRRLERARE